MEKVNKEISYISKALLGCSQSNTWKVESRSPISLVFASCRHGLLPEKEAKNLLDPTAAPKHLHS